MVQFLIDIVNHSGGEVNNQPSLTVPGQAYSAKQAASLALRNIPVPESKPVYDGYDYIDENGNTVKEGVTFNDDPDFGSMDKLDLMDFRENLKNSIQQNLASCKTAAEPEPSPQAPEPAPKPSDPSSPT